MIIAPRFRPSQRGVAADTKKAGAESAKMRSSHLAGYVRIGRGLDNLIFFYPGMNSYVQIRVNINYGMGMTAVKCIRCRVPIGNGAVFVVVWVRK